ncbi:hypothetical protein ABPG77_000328 [Micractinium sp. CCAP 211/92]
MPIKLANHPPTYVKGLAAQALMVVQVVALATVFAGRQAEPWLARLGIQLPPDIWRTLEEKKMMVLLGIWFGGGTIRQNLLSTGAFEVSYGGTPIFSKLDTGRLPTMSEVVGGIAEAIAAAGGAGAGAAATPQ